MTRSKMPLICLFAVLAIALPGASLLSADGDDAGQSSSIDQTANDPSGDDDSSSEEVLAGFGPRLATFTEEYDAPREPGVKYLHDVPTYELGA